MALANDETLRKQFRKANFHGGMLTVRHGLMSEAQAIEMEQGDVESILERSSDESQSSCDLGYSHLTTVPERLLEFTHLTSVNLESNCLHTIPDDFGGLCFLTTLNLRRNRLHELPATLCMMDALETLDISNNLIRTLPIEFADMVNLKKLVADFNYLQGIPECVFEGMPLLEALYVVENSAIVSVPETPEQWGSQFRAITQKTKEKFYIELDNAPELVTSVQRLQNAAGARVTCHNISAADAEALAMPGGPTDAATFLQTVAPMPSGSPPDIGNTLNFGLYFVPRLEIKWNKIWPDIVVDHVALGSLRTVQNPLAVSQLNVTHVLTCGRNLQTPTFPSPIRQLVLDVDDSEEEDMNQYFLRAIEFLADCVANQGLCIVHCFAGVSRSATVVVAYLMYTQHWRFEDALKFVQKHRPAANPNPNFRRQLQEFEKMCLVQS